MLDDCLLQSLKLVLPATESNMRIIRRCGLPDLLSRDQRQPNIASQQIGPARPFRDRTAAQGINVKRLGPRQITN